MSDLEAKAPVTIQGVKVGHKKDYHCCRICNVMVVKTKAQLMIHVSTHKLSLNEYFKTHVKSGDLEFTKWIGRLQSRGGVKRVCLVCGAQNILNIEHHLSERHMLDLRGYFAHYVKKDMMLRKMKGLTKKLKVKVEDLALIGYYKKDWMQQCQFVCNVCQVYTTDSEGGILQHLRSEHEEEYLTTGCTELLWQDEKKYLKCRLCDQEVLLTKEDVTQHSEDHNLSNADFYRSQFNITSKSFKINELRDLGLYKK